MRGSQAFSKYTSGRGIVVKEGKPVSMVVVCPRENRGLVQYSQTATRDSTARNHAQTEVQY